MTTYKLRVSGTSADFISEIDPHWPRCASGRCLTVDGWDNDAALTFDTEAEAETAARLAEEVEGFRIDVIEWPHPEDCADCSADDHHATPAEMERLTEAAEAMQDARQDR